MNYNNVIFEKSFGTYNQLEKSDLPEVCFCGRSNVGKSSLINKILGRKSIARVSSKPGKTITINLFKVDKIRFVDLPGYGYAKVPFSEKSRWSELMEEYFKSNRDIRMAFQLIDIRHTPSDFDISMLSFLNQMNIPYTIVLTKSDKLNKTEKEKRLSMIDVELGHLGKDRDIIPFSINSSESVDRIRDIIEISSKNVDNKIE